MHINFHSSNPPKTSWWKLGLLVAASAIINYGLVFLFQYIRTQNIGFFQPLLSLANQYNPDYRPPEQPYSPTSLFYKWDSYFYTDIAQNGYTQKQFSTSKKENWAFYPLYPGLISAIATPFALAGLSSTDAALIVGMFLSNIFLWLGLLSWQKVFQQLRISFKIWWLFLALLLTFPTAYIYNFVFTESLFLWLSGLFFVQLARHRYIAAGWLTALLTITRITGIIFLPVLLASFWFNHAKEHQPIKQISWLIGLSLISLTPLFLFLSFLGAITGEPLAPLRIQEAWDNAGFIPFNTFIGYLNDYGLTVYPPHILSVLLLAGSWALVLDRCWKLIKQEKPFGSFEWSLLFATIFLTLINSSIQTRNSIFRYTTTIPWLYYLLSVQVWHHEWRWGFIVAALSASVFLHVVFLAFFVLQIPMYAF